LKASVFFPSLSIVPNILQKKSKFFKKKLLILNTFTGTLLVQISAFNLSTVLAIFVIQILEGI